MCRLYLLLLFSPLLAFATSQVPDRLIWQGDTLQLHTYPFSAHPNFQTLFPSLFGTNRAPFTTACWRGYVAEWEIQRDTLFLVHLYTCDYPKNQLKADLNALFPSQLRNGKLPASWFSKPLLIPTGPLLYDTPTYVPIYKNEKELTLKNGLVTHFQDFDNSKTQLSVYAENYDTLTNFIYQNINWEIVPQLGQESVRVFAQISSSSRPLPDSIKLIKKADGAIFNNEVLRVLQSIPSWSCFYKRGAPYTLGLYVAVVFDENHRKKYARR